MSINVCTPRGEGRDRRADRRLPLHRRLRQDAVPAGAARHRRAPRRDAAEVPPAGRAARPGRAAQGHLRHRHPRRRHQRADPHRAVHRAEQVRRRADPPPQGPRVPPDRRPGRAGRLSTPPGTVVVQAPDHVVENEKARRQGRRRPEEAASKVVRKKPPEGFVSWGKPTFERLVAAEPEPLTSSFAVSHAMLLNVIAPTRRRVRRDAPPAHRQPRGRGRRSCATSARPSRSTARCSPPASSSGSTSPTRTGRTRPAHRRPAARLRAQPAAVAVRARRDRAARPGVADATPWTCVSVIESTLEDPRQVLSAQQFKARGEAVAQMKADGIEYDERMELLEDGHLPEAAGRAARGRVRDLPRAATRGSPTTSCRPSRSSRDMYERAMTFVEYVGFYGLARSEGLVLRYLADAYKALRQTVPEEARTEELDRPHRVARRAGPPGRLQPARRVGGAAQPGRVVDPTAAPGGRPAAAGHRQRAGVPGAGAQRAVPPGRAGRAAPLRRARRARRRRRLGRRRVGAALEPLLRGARRDRHRARRPRAGAADDRRAAGPLGRSGRSSTTRPATTTGASAPRSTSPPPTRPGPRS